MKKLFTLLSLTLLLALGWSAKAMADTKTVYFSPSDNWKQGSAKFALYMWKSDNSMKKCVAFTETTTSGLYSASYDTEFNGGIILVRVKNDTDFGSYPLSEFPSTDKWNQSKNIAAPTTDVYYTETSGEWENWSPSITKTLPTSIYVSGDRDITKGYEEWGSTSVMTDNGAMMYELELTNQAVVAGSYEYKIVVDGVWKGDPSNEGANFKLAVGETGLQTIKYTYNPLTDEITGTATKTDDAALVKKYTVMEYTTDYAKLGDMVLDAGGKFVAYTSEARDVTAGDVLKYKIVEGVYNGETPVWTVWHGAANTDVDTNYNLGQSFTKSSKYTVTFNLRLSDNSISTTPTELFTDYYIVKEGEPWTVQGKMHLVSGTTYTGGVEDWAGKCFAVAPNTALNDDFTGIKDWNKVLRPKNEGSNYVVEFNNYADDVETKAENATNDKVWKVADTNDGMVDIAIYKDGTFSITCCTQAAIGEEGYATYSVSGPCEITDGGATAYIVVEEGGSYKLKEIPAGKAIPANTGIILKGAKGNYNVASSLEEAADVSGNLLKGTGGYTSYVITGNDGVKDYTPYIFAKGNNGVGFYLIQDYNHTQTIGAHKAFLALPKGAPARQFIGFDETGEATGISASLNEKGAMTNEKVFNLSGQRVSQPTKGLYIVNGKKFVK